MGSISPAGYKRIERLLFVTTEAAKDRFGRDKVDEVGDIVGNRLFTIPGNPADVYAAAGPVGDRLRQDRSIRGVVILGDYETVPSRAVETFSLDLLGNAVVGATNPGVDNDLWRVWNDDLYGDNDNDRLGELPVSRLPIVPQAGGFLGSLDGSTQAGAPVIGLRSVDCEFADKIYGKFLSPQAPKMRLAPPAGSSLPETSSTADEANDMDEGDLAANRLYLMLHGSVDPGTPFWGREPGKADIAAVDFTVAGGSWQSRGTVFAGVCWGALIASSALSRDWDRVLEPRSAENSLALAFLDRGANAYVGFTGLHYIPTTTTDLIFGAPLHYFFWKNVIVRKWPPALALFRARARFIADAAKRSTDPLSIEKDKKTFWSATCLGLGW